MHQTIDSSASLNESHDGADHNGKREGFEYPPFTQQGTKAFQYENKSIKRVEIGNDELTDNDSHGQRDKNGTAKEGEENRDEGRE